jgi:hypothetical protein
MKDSAVQSLDHRFIGGISVFSFSYLVICDFAAVLVALA